MLGLGPAMTDHPYRSVDWRGWPSKRRYPWEQHMTVCIAAPCLDAENKDESVSAGIMYQLIEYYGQFGPRPLPEGFVLEK